MVQKPPSVPVAKIYENLHPLKPASHASPQESFKSDHITASSPKLSTRFAGHNTGHGDFCFARIVDRLWHDRDLSLEAGSNAISSDVHSGYLRYDLTHTKDSFLNI
jgi:hypothetical protein